MLQVGLDELVARLLRAEVAGVEQALATGLLDELLRLLSAAGREGLRSEPLFSVVRSPGKTSGRWRDSLVLLLRQVADGNVGSLARKENGNGASDARVATGHDRGLVLQLVRAGVLLEARLAAVPALDLRVPPMRH